MDNKTPFDRLVIAAYRLPFKLSKTRKGYKAIQNSGGLVSAILALSENFKNSNKDLKNSKIVWAGIANDLPGDATPDSFENENFDILPVTIDNDVNDLYYGGFCNDLIWPLFHYFPTYAVFDNDYFKAYEEANLRFCDELVKTIKPGDFIWIHDYQLMLLPEMIRKKMPEATIGFFLHIPFPSFELFRLLPRQWRESVIKGLLGADLVGFHTHDYAQNFIKSVKRTTGYECHQNTIYTPNKLVKADAFPIGIDYDKFHDACLKKQVLAEKEKLKNNLLTNKLIFSVDRLDYSKGLLLKLKGYETFLETYPEWRSKVVFNMVVVPSRDNIDKYRNMKREIESTVGRINGKFSSLSWQSIIYQYKSLTFNELVALYDFSDVGLITPLRDGMNLVAKEYVACQVENNGVLILSEMAGAAAELNEALIINPVDNIEMAEAIFNALEMKLEDKQSRLERMKNRISNYNVFTWAFDFFNQTYDTKEEQKKMRVRFVNPAITKQIVSDYQKAERRILFLDYDGTLVPFEKYPEMAIILKETRGIIKKLSKDPKNQVVIISGRDKEFLETQFAGINVNLVAEHGYFIKKGYDDWETAITGDEQWKEAVLPILNEYVSRCNGTFIEEKTGSIAWHYRNAESDFAQLRLHELRDDLAEIIRHKTDFEILEGHKVLEVKSGKYDKGQAAIALINGQDFGFIFAAGDDKTDEFLFKALPDSSYTIRVGLSPSFAKYNVTNISELLNLLGVIDE
ncbi:MAG TPA: bifunctional alpha,alpha-trehalose-phosphate synthase (UDP-forming)/trehalose-phosphatase [Prolixibacteraceae bacterium]|nr:bifunctional alpha,alpha-trehalose-phosphate synthase (UDP-forming)/trehalose-phosphatase [Prolixibacteraceae bacterium]